MSIDNTIRPGPSSVETPDLVPFHDTLNQRLRWAVLVSVIVNIFLWSAASGIARRQKYHDPKPVEVTRVIIDPKTNRKIVKVVTKKQIEKRVAHVQRKIQQRRPEWRPPRHVSAPPPKPQGAHHRVLLAKGPAS